MDAAAEAPNHASEVPSVIAKLLERDTVLPFNCLWNTGPYFPSIPVSSGRRLLVCAEFMAFHTEEATYADFYCLNTKAREVVRVNLVPGVTFIEFCPREITIKPSGYHLPRVHLPLPLYMPTQSLVMRVDTAKKILPLYTLTEEYPFRLMASPMRGHEPWSYNAGSHLHVPHKVLHVMDEHAESPETPLFMGERLQRTWDSDFHPFFFPMRYIARRYRLEVVGQPVLPYPSYKDYAVATHGAYGSPYASHRTGQC